MTWLIEEEADQRQLAEQFRELVTVGPIVKIPGTHDGMAATIARQSGFKAIYLSGAAYTAGRGLQIYESLQEGGEVDMPLQETFFSPGYGSVTDKFGVTFQIFTEGKQ